MGQAPSWYVKKGPAYCSRLGTLCSLDWLAIKTLFRAFRCELFPSDSIPQVFTNEENLRNFAIWKNLTANTQEIGSSLHSFIAKIHVDTFMKFISCLICAFSLDF